jgi:hypothetical protein
MLETNRVMFEIYREKMTGEYRVVYFTELNDHTRDKEIDKALAGDHFYDGFIKEFKKDDAKQLIEGILDRLNNGESIESEDLEIALGDHIPAIV